MLNRRQLEIVLELFENPGQYMTASYYSQKQQVSLRTIQSDIKAIKEELSKRSCVEFQSVTPKGSRVLVKDQTVFAELKDSLYREFCNTSMGYQNERVSKLLFLLLAQHRPISYYDVETKMFVSHSTLVGDLKRADEILKKYDLEVMRGSSKIVIDGSEINKRMCITEENLAFGNVDSDNTQEGMKKIKDILVEAFISFKHNVSEVDLNNMILYLSAAEKRMEGWFFIAPNDLQIDQDLYPERKVAEAVFSRLGDVFHLRIPDAEIDYFTLFLKGRVNLTSPAVISPEMDALVLDGLREIRSVFNIDLTNDVNFRISLALHCTSMLVRLKYNMQMTNQLVDYIRQNFPQGFDLATHFCSFLQKRYNKKVEDEEIAYIAIHIYKALTDLQKGAGTKRVLVISPLRRSENILIRQTLYRWFENQIAELYFLPPSDMDESYLDRYDTFLTTEKGKHYNMGLAIYMNPFPDQHDYLNLKLALDGFESINDILDIFHRNLFEVFKADMERDEILRVLCEKAGSYFGLEELHKTVLEREQMGSTFFGNGIAAPHPMSSGSTDTFISVGITQRPVVWDAEGHKVNLVMLITVSKNNTKAFQVWNYLSKVFARRDFVAQLLLEPTYECFLKLVKDTIAKDFKG